MNVSNQVKLCMFDDFWIDFRKGTIRRWFEPQYVAEYYDRDFELNCYCQLVCDKENEKYRLFYEVLPDTGIDCERFLALAEGTDLNNIQPVEVNSDPDSKMRHVVFAGEPSVHGAGVFHDLYDPDPTRRYKFSGMTGRSRKDPKNPWIPVVLAFSPDGIHWKHHPELIANLSTSDAYNQLFYNPYKEEYVLLHRAAYVDRRIAIKTSKDLENWSPSRIVLQPGPQSNDNAIQTQYYSMGASYMEGIFLGLLWRYTTSLVDIEHSKMWGRMEPELVYSHDGELFMPTSGKAVIQRPLPPACGCMQLWMTSICESLDGKEYILTGTGVRSDHGASDEMVKQMKEKYAYSGATLFYKIRKDGFCGIEGLGNESNVIFRPMQILQNDLSFNINANCGSARFAVMKKDCSFFEGFSFDDCIPFVMNNDICVCPQWKEHNIGELLGKQIRIAVELNDAILHAVSATARPFNTQLQMGFHDPEPVSQGD